MLGRSLLASILSTDFTHMMDQKLIKTEWIFRFDGVDNLVYSLSYEVDTIGRHQKKRQLLQLAGPSNEIHAEVGG